MPLFEWPALGWLALAVVSAIVEVSIPHFGLVFVAIGAVGAAVAAALGLSDPVQSFGLSALGFAVPRAQSPEPKA